MRTAALALLLASACHSPAVPKREPRRHPTVVSRAVLPADTFAPGPPSGRFIKHPKAPFVSQPVQGFSALIADGEGVFLALTDNGYGSMENSADFHLRAYRIRADFPRGRLEVLGHFELSDPDRRVPFPIVNGRSRERILTGADFDPESFQRVSDSTFWIGDEFGPYLLHVDPGGRLLDPPVPLPGGLRSPQAGDSMLRRMNFLRPASGPVPVASPKDGAFDPKLLMAAGYPVVVWTVNERARMDELLALGVSGIISDFPDLLYGAVAAFEGGRLLLPDGRIDPAKFDAQGHRGARGMRAENTLAAMEAGLDALMTTLETDAVVTSDGVAVLSHDPILSSEKCRTRPVPVRELTLQQVQRIECGEKKPSPIAEAFARAEGLPSARVPPTVDQLIRFLGAYAEAKGKGAQAENARRVRLSIEAKVREAPPVIVAALHKHGFEARADVQSFEQEDLRWVQEHAPSIRTVYLYKDPPPPPARVAQSGGFEGMALGKDGLLYPMLEKPLAGEDGLRVYAFDPVRKAYTGASYTVPLPAGAKAAGDFNTGFLIARDDTQRDLNGFKRLLRVSGSTLSPAADLLALGSALQLEPVEGDLGLGNPFAFPFCTIETVLELSPGVVAVMNDNNYPFGAGRHAHAPDDTELILVELP
ncbi:MAG: esterase-like activity of phytase family protein [Myxococcaceae bacterium]